jgi:hypothetical protein
VRVLILYSPLTWLEVSTAIIMQREELLMRVPSSKAAYIAALAVRRAIYRATADIIRHRFFLGRPHYVSDTDKRLACDSSDISKPAPTEDLEALSHHSLQCPASASATSVHDSVCVHYILRKTSSTVASTVISAAATETKCSSTSTLVTPTSTVNGEVAKLIWTLNEFPYALENGIYHSLLWCSAGPLTHDEVEHEIHYHFMHSIIKRHDPDGKHSSTSTSSSAATSTPSVTASMTLTVDAIYDWCWFVNPPALQSVPDVWHAQIFWRYKPSVASSNPCAIPPSSTHYPPLDTKLFLQPQ